MFDLIASILDLFYQWTSSYGLAIIMLTLLAMIVVLPFTLKGTRSMIEMQRMQPELKKIQTRYKDDRQKQNEEVMKFYQENNINPLGGCLPMFIQLPVFLVLFQILRGLTRRATSIGEFIGGAANIGTNLPTFDARTRVFNPAYLSDESELRAALESDTEMNFLGLDLAPSTSEMVSRGIGSAFPYVILILIVFGTGWIQHKQIQGRASANVNPQQQTIMKIMPFILPVISYTLPAAMLLYFVVSNVFRIAQQAYITKNIYGNEPNEVVLADAKKQSKPAANKPAANKPGANKKAQAKNKAAGNQKSSNARSTSTEGASTSSAKGRRTKAGPRPASSNQQTKGQSGRTASGGRTTEPGTVSPRARKKKR